MTPRRFASPTRRTALAGIAALAGSAALPGTLRAAAPLTVVATTGMIADAVRNLGGEAVSVEALMGPGVDPHAFRQTRSDIAAMTGADLVLWHGLYLEAQMEDFLRQLAERKPVTAVAEGLPQDLLIAHDDYDDKFDPHVWMDPALWRRVISAVADAMSAVRPEAAETFAARAETYGAEVAALGAYTHDILSTVPEASRVLLTAHDAFNYFGATYGFDVVGIQGISTESEAGLARIEDLVAMLVERDIRAVFVESSVSDRNIRALVEGAAARGHEVVIGGELYSDAMGEPGTYEGTYLGIIDHNTTTIARALGGTAPERGRLGLLAAS
ncbi:MAG: zinc ABC transporter substrate-binding protein [Pseudomonadota bacterium]